MRGANKGIQHCVGTTVNGKGSVRRRGANKAMQHWMGPHKHCNERDETQNKESPSRGRGVIRSTVGLSAAVDTVRSMNVDRGVLGML
jgi:hypothetical protein